MISFQIFILQAKVMKTDDKGAEKSAMAKPGLKTNWNLYLGGGFKYIFIITPIRGRFPIWLIFFKWFETTNQLSLVLGVSFVLKNTFFKSLWETEAFKTHQLWRNFCCEATSASVLMRTKICFTSGVMATNPAASMRRTDGRMGRCVSTLRLGV